MSEQGSDNLGKKPTEQGVGTSIPKSDEPRAERFPFGLSAERFARVARAMQETARKVCRHSGVSPKDAVQEAFVTALSKPMADRPSIDDEKKFVAWICAVTKYEALTLCIYARRQADREVASLTDIAEMVVVPPTDGAVEARKMLHPAFLALEPEDQKLLSALFAEEKTIDEIAQDQERAWTTVASRRQRVLNLLYTTLQSTVAALVLLLPSKARAFVAHVAHRTPHLLAQAKLFGGAIAVTAVFGVVLAASSSAMNVHSTQEGLTSYSTPPGVLEQAAVLPPRSPSEVAPEEPKDVDAETNACSPVDMKSTKFTTVLQKVLVPAAITAVPMLTHVACGGTQQQTQCPPEWVTTPEEEEKEAQYIADRAYESMCDWQRAQGKKCVTRKQWDNHEYYVKP